MSRLLRLGGTVGVIHACEDVFLMSLGRWPDAPLWLLYIVGIAVSTILLTVIINRVTLKMR